MSAIKRIARSMSKWSYEDVDQVFQQFGVPTSKTWEQGNHQQYLLHHLHNAATASLIELDIYLSAFGEQKDVDSDAWQPGHLRLFLTHSSKDRDFVCALKAALLPCGVDGFVADEDIKAGTEWEVTILNALRSCHALAAILTPDSEVSRWCDQEIGIGIGLNKLVIPVERGRMPQGFIAKIQSIRAAKDSPADIAKRLAQVLATHPKTRAHIGI